MRPIRAELARRRAPHRAWWWVIAFLLGAASVLFWVSKEYERKGQEVLAEIAAIEQARAAAARAASSVVAPPPPYEASAREMLAQATTPWPTVLDVLEAVELPGARVISLDYSAREAQARVKVKLAQQGQVVEYVTALNTGLPAEGPAWRWTIVRVEQIGAEGSAHAEIVARWGNR